MSVNIVYLDRDEFTALKQNMSQDEGIRYLMDMIRKGEIDFPYKNSNYEEAWDAFIGLIHHPCKGFEKIDDGFTRFDYKRPFDNMLLSEPANYLACSDYFNEKIRYMCTHQKHPIPACDTFKDERQLYSSLKALWTMKMDRVDTSNLRAAIRNTNYIASQFRVCNAKAIYQHFNSKVVYDISMGWGDRLAGFWSLYDTEEYWGSDPNKELFKNYFKQAELYSKVNGRKDYRFFNEPAESLLGRKTDSGEFVVPSNYFDTVFSSPPYFGCEKYSDGTDNANQSWKKYDSASKWVRYFLFPVLIGCYRILKPGGYLVINISDVMPNTGRKRLCDPMCDFVDKYLRGLKYVGMYGMELAVKPNTLSRKGHFFEPIWVWQKKE